MFGTGRTILRKKSNNVRVFIFKSYDGGYRKLFFKE